MSLPPAFTDDVSELPTHAFGYKSLTWWGVVGFMVIEGVAFAMAIAAYFFLMSHERSWAPEATVPPGLIAGTLFTLVMLVSEIPNAMVKKAAKSYDVDKVRELLPVLVAIGVLLLMIRGFEFNSLNVLWYDSAYGSILWALLLLHTAHMATDWVDTTVLWRLMNTPHGHEPRRLVDTEENCFYWRFVWMTWLPIYLLIYWVPRLLQ